MRNYNFSFEDGKFTETRVPPPIPVERFLHYRALMDGIGLEGAVVNGDDRVYFEFDEAALNNGDSHKGFCYSPEKLPLTTALDGIRKPVSMGNERYFTFKALSKSEWYLYLCIN